MFEVLVTNYCHELEFFGLSSAKSSLKLFYLFCSRYQQRFKKKICLIREGNTMYVYFMLIF